VAGREIGYLFGQYKRLRNEFTGVLTGKALNWGGSLIRPEATGYGATYFAAEMLATRNDTLEGKICTVLGIGQRRPVYCEKVNQMGGKCVSLSDSNGTVYDKNGIDAEKLAWIMDLKNNRRGRIKEYADKFKGVEYRDGARPWDIPCQVASPARRRTKSARRTPKPDQERLLRNQRRRQHAFRAEAIDIYWKTKFCTAPARRPMRAAWLPPDWKWRRTRSSVLVPRGSRRQTAQDHDHDPR
jgi:hypothetical protein